MSGLTRPAQGGRLRRIVAAGLLAAMFAGMGFVCWWLASYAAIIHGLADGTGETMFLDGDGAPWFPLEERRREVPLGRISPALRSAIVAVEDRRFFGHHGVDPLAVARALVRNALRRTPAEGASTITQQLARTLFLSRERSLGRKVREAALALLLERLLTKERILELYLNRVPLGPVHGVEAFSREYLGKSAADLTLGEAALVAGVIRAPTALSPRAHLDRALARRRVVLSRLREEGLIGEAELRAALAEVPRVVATSPARDRVRSGYAQEHLRQAFRDLAGEEDPFGWTIGTTFSVRLQRAAEAAVETGLARLGHPGLQAALVALDPETGDLLALVGGSDPATSPFNRAVRANRQPGSAFKPFVYGAALEAGDSPVTRIEGIDSPGFAEEAERLGVRVAADDPAALITYREALFRSVNEAALAVQRRAGTDGVRDFARRAGLPDQPPVASLALGTGQVTPLQLAAAYAAIANGGFAVTPRSIRRIRDQRGAVVSAPEVSRRKGFSPAVAWQLLSMLRDVVERGTGAAAGDLGVPAAGKTGTTDDSRDAWFVGFSPRLVAAVWVGFDRPAPIAPGASAATVAVPLWADFMRRAAASRPAGEFTPPDDLYEAPLCAISFRMATDRCPTYHEHFKAGDAVPDEPCQLHRGTLPERVGRAIRGFFRRLGDLFRGK